MALTFSQKMQELKRVIRLHANWLVYATLGESALTTAEVTELKKYGKLPMGQPLDLVDKSYLLGRLRSLLKRQEYQNVNYEELDSLPLSPIEELVVEQARLRAGQALKGVAQEIANGTYSSLAQVLGKAVSEAMVTQAVADETALAIIHRKTAQELASNLAQRLQTTQRKNWRVVAETALQAAKVAGSAQAIVNKIGVYALSDGAESLVSVIPGPSCCDDCTAHYVGPDGQPRVFKLSTLMGAGSNADGDVTHQKQNGRHVYWKTTLPPLHPSCGCSIVYIPPGHGWVGGKLSMLNKSLFVEHLAKARSGVSGGISPTVEPQGAPSAKSEEPKTPSMPGAAAPENNPGPGRTPGSLPKPGSGTPGGMGGGTKFIACPWDKCPIGHHEPNSATYREHAQIAAHNREFTPQAEEQNKRAFGEQAKQYNAQPHPRQEIAHSLANSRITSTEKLGGEAAGINAAYKITLENGGSALMKPNIDKHALLREAYKKNPAKLENKSPAELNDMVDKLATPGNGTMAADAHPHAEAGMSMLADSLGLAIYPTTVLRAHDGNGGGPVGNTSVQHWRDNAVSTNTYGGKGAGYTDLIRAAPKEHKDKMHEQFATIAVMDVVSNAGDRHLGNILVDKETHDLIPIDHGVSFGNSLQGHRNDIAMQMHAADVALTIPPKLHEKLKNQSLESTMRAMDKSGLPEWSTAQTYLRTKYALHMQDKFGHIPFDRIRPSLPTGTGDIQPYWSPTGTHGWDDVGGVAKFFALQENKELPHDHFESFAKTWISERANDPTHPEHAEGKRLMEIQPLRTSAHVTGKEKATPADLKAHFDSIKAYDMSEPDAEKFRRNMPHNKEWADESKASARTPPNMEKTPVRTPNKQRSAEKKTPVRQGNKFKKDESVVELQDSDIEELDPNKNYGQDAHARTELHLDLSEFENKQVKKSLYLSNPHAVFTVK